MSKPDPAPGIAGLGAFRGKTTRTGAPVLPPGWRPDAHDRVAPATAPADVAVRPVERPPVAPVGARSVTTLPASPPAPEATVVPATVTGSEVRIVRKVRPWSVWKLTLAFAVCMVAVTVTAAAVLWAVAASLGVLDNVEGFVEDLGFDDFAFDGGTMLRALVLGGLIVAAAASMMAFLLAVMFNLLSDLTGGIETELAPKRPKTRSRRRRRRRRRSRSAEPEVEDVPVIAGSQPEPGLPAPAGETVPAAGVELPVRNGASTLDLTDDPDVLDGPIEVDQFQLALDDLLADLPPSNGNDQVN